MKNYLKKYVLVVGLLVMAFSVSAQWGSGMRGEGPTVTKTIDLDEITGIGLGIPADVYLMYGKKQKVEIEAQKNIIDNIERDIKSGVWRIEFEKNVKNMDPVKIYVTLSNFEKLSIGGSGSIIGKDAFQLGKLKVSIAGSGEIELEGTAEDLEVSIAGFGDVKLRDLKVEDCQVSIAGSGDCEVYVDASLKVSIAGSGDVKYKGNPDKVKSSIAGSGDVRSF